MTMKTFGRQALPVTLVAAGLSLSACDADWGLLAEAMAAQSSCPNCTFEQNRQYMDQMNPQRVAERRNDELSANRNNYSAPHVWRCRYENYSPSGAGMTHDIRVQNGEWYFGQVGSANTPSYCNSARVNSSGHVFETACTLNASILRLRTSVDGGISTTTIYQDSGRAVISSYNMGDDGDTEGRCTPVR